jgi:hypothetical protein
VCRDRRRSPAAGGGCPFGCHTYDWRTETAPRLRVTGRRLDASAPAVTVSDATNGFEQSMGAFMLVGLELPAGGCWELTGHYHGSSLRLVVWVTRWQP